jgi:hypothetical protein
MRENLRQLVFWIIGAILVLIALRYILGMLMAMISMLTCVAVIVGLIYVFIKLSK